MRESGSDAHARRRCGGGHGQPAGERENARRLTAILGNAGRHPRRVPVPRACPSGAAAQSAMTATAAALAGLKRHRPEWAPWLDVVEETLRDVDASTWDEAVPVGARTPHGTTPLLAG